MDQKRNALLRGPHKSAKDHATFLQQEFASMLQKQQWTLLPAALVTELQQLRLSPLGVIPQHDRRPRTIADYTFFHVNQDTVPLGPPEAMQFGRSLRCLLTKILYADPRFGPVYLCKIDIADGFYRIWLLPCDIPKLGVLFPTNSGEPPLIGFPLTLPMGWVESPPFSRPPPKLSPIWPTNVSLPTSLRRRTAWSWFRRRSQSPRFSPPCPCRAPRPRPFRLPAVPDPLDPPIFGLPWRSPMSTSMILLPWSRATLVVGATSNAPSSTRWIPCSGHSRPPIHPIAKNPRLSKSFSRAMGRGLPPKSFWVGLSIPRPPLFTSHRGA